MVRSEARLARTGRCHEIDGGDAQAPEERLVLLGDLLVGAQDVLYDLDLHVFLPVTGSGQIGTRRPEMSVGHLYAIHVALPSPTDNLAVSPSAEGTHATAVHAEFAETVFAPQQDR